MAEITAGMVKSLRESTGVGMMDCKAALAATNGDMEAATDLLRKRAGAKVEKKSGRIAAEGAVGIYVTPDRKTAAMIEVNCETDFVAKGDDFAAFATAAAVTTAGSVGFVGLVVPHGLRMVIGNDQRVLLPASVLTGGTLLLNSPHNPEEVWKYLPPETQRDLIAKKAKVYTIDAMTVARAAGRVALRLEK